MAQDFEVWKPLKLQVQVGLPKCSDGILELEGRYEAHAVGL